MSSTKNETPIKMSLLNRKPGFVIPKNKFSGSLVPIFKSDTHTNVAADQPTPPHLHRNTKWGPDLTLDSSVRRSRALAYQTRLDQITRQLKSDSLSPIDASCALPPHVQLQSKLQTLELERQEAIGEILKLNPKYKAPSDYQPVVREATIPIPVKAYPDYNFLGLVCGSDGETQKRLEKETGTKIQVCGTKSKTNEKIEITASNGSELISSCEEVYVQISSDTWEKVDAAAALIELLLSSVKPVASTSLSGDNNVQGFTGDQNIATVEANNSVVANQELQPGVRSITTSSQVPFQPYPSSWLLAGQSNAPTSMGSSFSPLPTCPLLGPGLPASFGGGSTHLSTAVPTPILHTPAPVMPGSFMPPAYPSSQIGPLRNISPSTTPLLVGHQPTLAGSPRISSSQLDERPLTYPNPSGWVMPHVGPPQSLASGAYPSLVSSLGSLISQPMTASASAQFPPPHTGPGSATSFVASQIRSLPMPTHTGANATLVQQLIFTANNALRPSQNPSPSSSATNAPSFTPLTHAGPTGRGPSLPGSSDFTFQPSRPLGVPSHSFLGPGLHFASQRPAPVPLPPAPQGPSFRPAMQNTILQPNRQNFPGPHIGNQMGIRPGQFGPQNINPHVGPRHIGSISNVGGGSFPPRGNLTQYQQNYPVPPLSRPGSSFAATRHPITSGRPQVYDPFSPTSMSAAQSQGDNIGKASKQETDAEYEDLMESVGVK